jgi:hypothetical protein
MSEPLSATIYRDSTPIRVTGRYCEAEPEVGVTDPWIEVEGATALGVAVELSESEVERATEALWDEAEHQRDRMADLEEDAWDARRDAEMERER